MAFTILDPMNYVHEQALGIRGAAYLLLSSMVAQATEESFVADSPANVASLKKAAAQLREQATAAGSTVPTFSITRVGDDYREVSYAVKRDKADGSTAEWTVTRQYLNVKAIRVVYLKAEADRLIAEANANATETL